MSHVNNALDRVETLAKIGASLLGVQFDATEIATGELEGDAFAFGYCFGLFDAMAQCAKLDQFSDGATMIANGFGKLVNDGARGKTLFAGAIERVEEPEFSSGYERGAADLMAWAADANKLPAGIARRGRRNDAPRQ
jgi:hypothetical protein